MNLASLPSEPATCQPSRWAVQLLGQVQAIGAERDIVHWPSRAVAALLATLALEPQRTHPREQLIERLWPGVAPDVGRNRLRQALSVLRALLEPAGGPGAAVLLADRTTLRVVPGAIDCDVHRFEQQARAGQLESAMALYRGEFMPGFYDDWVLEERERLAAIHERLATVGLRTLPATRSTGPATAAPAANWRPAVDLPHYLTRLFGAEPAAARLRAMLLEHRLVTVTGPGGIGKTRLAVEVAHSLVPAGAQPAEVARFDRIGFVPVVDCRDRAQLLDALQSHLRAAGQGNPLERIASALHGRRTLLLLDNFEQLVDRAADVVATLLARVPSLQLLVTSRRALGVDGERLFVTPGMTPPAPRAGLDEAARNPAMALFVDRAQAVRADFHLGSGNHAALVALLHRLDGLPLAVELAASRVRSLSPAEMLATLGRPPGTRGDVLARRGTRAALDPRHASMQQVVGWSWDLLDARLQALLQALVPFEGGCTSAAAAAVLGDADAASKLDELVGHSLLVTQDGMSGRIRFALHEPVHEFAATRTGAQQVRRLRRRHREWVAAWAQALPATPPLPEVRDEWPNVAAAIGSAAADSQPLDAIELLLQLQRVVEDVGLPASALDAAAQAADAAGDTPRAAEARCVLAPALLRAGQAAQALAQATRALDALPPGTPQRPRALHAVARVIWRSRRDASRVLPLLDEADALLAGRDDPVAQAAQAALRAFVTNVHLRDPQAARQLHERALALWRRTGNRHAVLSGEYNLAVTDQNQGLNEQALQRLRPLVDEAIALHDWRRVAEAHNVSGNALCGLRRWGQAAAAFAESLQAAWQHAGAYELAYPLWNLPRALAHLRHPADAAQLAAFAARFWTERFGPLGERDRLDLRRIRRLAGVQIGAQAVAQAWRAGEALALPAALELALGAARSDPR